MVSEFAGDPDMAELIDYFVSELQDRVARLNAAVLSGNTEELRVIAHQLNGAAGAYGFPDITEKAAELEAACRTAGTSVPAVAEKVRSLADICRRAIDSTSQA